MIILIRTDSSNLIGSGHIMRCLTLAQRYCKEGHRVSFICRELEGDLTGLVEKLGFSVYMLPAVPKDDTLTGYGKWLTVTQEQDAVDTVALMRKLGHVDRLVVDSYALDETWEKVVRPYTNGIFVIDDLANRKHDCDILLDQNFYLNKDERYIGLVPKHCKLLLGPKHALLREEFYQAKKIMKPRNGELHNILVFYGGADATDETSKAMEALSMLKSHVELQGVSITVVVGESNTRKDSISNLCQNEGFRYLCQVNNMAELMAEADLMLGAGGTTLWERLAMGLPAVVTVTAENQIEACQDCTTVGFIYYIGYYEEVTSETIYEELLNIIRKHLLINMQNVILKYLDSGCIYCNKGE